MDTDNAGFANRLDLLERQLRRTRLIAAVAGIGLLATWITGAVWQAAPQRQDIVRAKVLIIEDADGRDRIVLGAPMPDGRQVTGLKILSPEGAEQFGLSLKADGAMGMGFDAKPGVGSQANRERLNLGVTPKGQGWIRYLDNQTRVRLYLQLDSAGAPALQFWDWPDAQRIIIRELGYPGEKTFEWKR
jgi:hypothetical protein